MADLSDHLKDALVKHVFTNVAYTSPTTVYLALHTAAATEVTGGTYGRQTMAGTHAGAGTCQISNTADEAFTGMPACTVTHLAVYDASTAGNQLAVTPLAVPRAVAAGKTFTVTAGDYTFTFS